MIDPIRKTLKPPYTQEDIAAIGIFTSLIVFFIFFGIMIVLHQFVLLTLAQEQGKDKNIQEAGGARGQVAINIGKDFFCSEPSKEPCVTEVNQGDKVIWINNSDSPQTVTAKNGDWDSGDIQSAKSFTYTFDKLGSHHYHSKSDPKKMRGIIVVKPAHGSSEHETPKEPKSEVKSAVFEEEAIKLAAVSGAAQQISIGDFFFCNQSFQGSVCETIITRGETVTWTNTGQASHTVTSVGNWDSGNIGSGGTFSRAFDTAGTFDYLCSFHPTQMKGRIIVTEPQPIYATPYGTPYAYPTPVSPVPIVDSFTATPNTISAGQSSTLAWQTTNATSVDITPGFSGIEPDGSRVVTPTSTTIYTITANGSGGTAQSSLTVIVRALTLLPARNLPACANAGATYGGSQSLGGLPEENTVNIITEFNVSGVVDAEFDSFHDGVRFPNNPFNWSQFNIQPNENWRLWVYWWGLSPGVTYTWQVRTKNPDGSFNAWTQGQPWTVPVCSGNILGRIWYDKNGNGLFDTGEKIFKSPTAPCTTGLPLSSAGAYHVSGPQYFTKTPDLCNPDPYYYTGSILSGTYTVASIPVRGWQVTGVSAPSDWVVNPDKSVTGILAANQSRHIWFGLNLTTIDFDNDRFLDGVEVYLDTYYSSSCPQTVTINDEKDSWPVDFNDDTQVNGLDAFFIAQYFNQTVPPAPVRADLNADGVINGLDVFQVSLMFNKTCRPSGLTAQLSTSPLNVGLSWTPPAVGNIDHYIIKRNGVEIGTSTTTSFTDSTLAPGTTYTYSVQAHFALSLPTPPSNTATVTIPSPGLYGKVTDAANGVAISGAEVRIDGPTKTTVFTDTQGNYQVVNIAAGTYQVEAKAVGFASQKKTVTVTSNTIVTLDFNLTK